MGSNDGDDDEKPVHSVTVSSFYMCDHEVTQKEYYDIMKNYPSLFNGDDRPVENVSWYDAIEYCNKKSIAEGLMPCYTIDKNRKDSNNNHPADKLKWTVTCNFRANGYRLPTEAEWEYAARGGIKSKGYKYSGSNILENVVWMKDETYDVKNTSPNELGIYDMSGNVGEWCWDWYGPYEISVQINPAGTPSGVFRVFRGGTWNDKDEACLYLVAHRSRLIGEWTFIGFRVVRSCIN